MVESGKQNQTTWSYELTETESFVDLDVRRGVSSLCTPKGQEPTSEPAHKKEEGEPVVTHDGDGGGGANDKRARLAALMAAFMAWLLGDKLCPKLLKTV